MGSLGSLQCHMRGCTGSSSMVSEPREGLYYTDSPGAVQ